MDELQPSTPAPDNNQSVDLAPSKDTTQNPASFKPEAAPDKPEAPKLTPRQALEKAAAEQTEANETKPAEKPKAEVKPEVEKPEAKTEQPRENGKFVKSAQETTESPGSTPEDNEDEQVGEQEKSRPSEGRGNREPPARLLPRERDEWIKAPNVVRDGVQRIVQEYEAEITESRTAKEEWGKLARYDEMAKQRGVTVERALEHYTGIDARLSQDLVGGLDHIARQYGYDLRQVAQHVLQQPADQHQQQMTQQFNELQGTANRLTQDNQNLQAQLKAANEKIATLEIVQPFVSSVGQERFTQLEPYIANFLNSGMIPSSLSGQQKLEHAFAMAERLYGPSQATGAVPEVHRETETKHAKPAGQRSIKGTPTNGAAEDAVKDKGKLKPRDAIKAAASELGIQV